MKSNFPDIKLITFIFSIIIIFKKIICPEFQYWDDITDNVFKECKEYGKNNRVKRFSDCSIKSNISNNQICCYLSGFNADRSHYEGCVAVNYTLFNNTITTYNSKVISGSLICTDDYTSHNYINISIFNIILFLGILFFDIILY